MTRKTNDSPPCSSIAVFFNEYFFLIILNSVMYWYIGFQNHFEYIFKFILQKTYNFKSSMLIWHVLYTYRARISLLPYAIYLLNCSVTASTCVLWLWHLQREFWWLKLSLFRLSVHLNLSMKRGNKISKL